MTKAKVETDLPASDAVSLQLPFRAVVLSPATVKTLQADIPSATRLPIPAPLIGQVVGSTALVTEVLGFSAMTRGLKSTDYLDLKYHLIGWHHGLATALKWQTEIRYLGWWVHLPDTDDFESLSSDDIEFILSAEHFRLPDMAPLAYGLLLTTLGNGDQFQTFGQVIDRGISLAHQVNVTLL